MLEIDQPIQIPDGHTHMADCWPVHVELSDVQSALSLLGAQIGTFNQYAEDQGDDAPRLRAIAAVARVYARFADTLAVDAEVRRVDDGAACRAHLVTREPARY